MEYFHGVKLPSRGSKQIWQVSTEGPHWMVVTLGQQRYPIPVP
jgi:hypothetical protein